MEKSHGVRFWMTWERAMMSDLLTWEEVTMLTSEDMRKRHNVKIGRDGNKPQCQILDDMGKSHNVRFWLTREKAAVSVWLTWEKAMMSDMVDR